MKTKTIYIAFDGREFEDETECYEYEMDKQFAEIQNELVMKDSKGNMVDIIDFDSCDYLVCKTKRAAEILYEWAVGYFGYNVPWNTKHAADEGYYFYNYDTEQWEDIEEKIDELEERLSFLRKIVG